MKRGHEDVSEKEKWLLMDIKGKSRFPVCCLSEASTRLLGTQIPPVPPGFPLSREYSLLRGPSHHAYSPQDLLSNGSALGFFYIVYNLAVSCSVYFPLHSLVVLPEERF